jgi:hypothetical protein
LLLITDQQEDILTAVEITNRPGLAMVIPAAEQHNLLTAVEIISLPELPMVVIPVAEQLNHPIMVAELISLLIPVVERLNRPEVIRIVVAEVREQELVPVEEDLHNGVHPAEAETKNIKSPIQLSRAFLMQDVGISDLLQSSISSSPNQ